jgi:hypothetical protein
VDRQEQHDDIETVLFLSFEMTGSAKFASLGASRHNPLKEFAFPLGFQCR